MRVVTDDAITDGHYTWSSDTTYLLDGYVFLEGGSITIEPGTRIEGKAVPSNGVDPASALIITRGAQIFAEGTEQEPIVFTAEGEDGTFSAVDDRGSWGGLILLGRATVGEDGGEDNVEGLPEEDRTTYGGADSPIDDDNSGVLKFVSIRYGGDVLSGDNEINGLTLGGVGSGTKIEFIEIFGNKDDGIEIFGGTVDIRYLITAFCGDDSFDTDESWAGRGQFWFAIQLPSDPSGNEQYGGEHDGSEADDLEPKTVHTIYNATLIGMGPTNGDGNGADNNGIRVRNDVAISYNNSIFVEFANKAMRMQNPSTVRYVTNDDFQLRNNLWNGFGDGTALTDIIRVDDDNITQQQVIDKLLAEGNSTDDPDLGSIGRMPNGMLDPRPNAGSPALSGAHTPDDDWFAATSYRGAFSAVDNWALGWTHLDEQGYFGDWAVPEVEVITDDHLEENTNYFWTNDRVYLLDGYVFLESGSCLEIEAGTRIEGKAIPTNGVDPASALIITRGAQIKAMGTADQPIVFTAEGEDGSFDPVDDRGSWGGLIILGRATVGEDGGEDNIEGLPEEDRTTYGGADSPIDNDDSGELHYISIRYAGDVLSGDNEINGLTLGGVGSETEIDHVEIFANADDGVEIFGGTVDIRNLIVAFCGDDSFDTDESWAGRGQFWLAIQYNQDPSGNEQYGGEHDGSEADDLEPKTVHTIYNATLIGMGPTNGDGNGADNNAIRVRNDVAISYNNSIFVEFANKAMRMQNPSTVRYVTDDDFQLRNNIWSRFGDGEDLTQVIRVDDDNITQAQVIAKLAAEGNQLVPSDEFDDIISSISREPNGMLDPRPNKPSLAFENVHTPTDAWFEAVDYRGAFGNVDNWALGWSHLAEQGYFGNLVSTFELGGNAAGLALSSIAPNPVRDLATLTLELPVASDAIVYVFDMNGKIVQVNKLGVVAQGVTNYELNTTRLASGQYVLGLVTESGSVSQQMTVVK